MRVLIVENEIYLAQSIALKLGEVGFESEIISAYDELSLNRNYDVILLSTNTPDFMKIIDRFKHTIIILLVSYISTDTVLNPLKMGASDYLQKPLMLEELLRKIRHYQDFRKISLLNKAYKNYIKTRLGHLILPEINYKKIKFPLLVNTPKQSLADAFVFDYINSSNLTLSYLSLSLANALDLVFKEPTHNNILYLSNFQSLKALEREKLLEFVRGKNAILHSTSPMQLQGFHTLDLSDNEKNIESSEILTIEEYIKYVISSYQNVFADTELSKKLGISRKSLWEKRKKYEISKKK